MENILYKMKIDSKDYLTIDIYVLEKHFLSVLSINIQHIKTLGWFRFMFMVFNATFNKISVISWRSVLLLE